MPISIFLGYLFLLFIFPFSFESAVVGLSFLVFYLFLFMGGGEWLSFSVWIDSWSFWMSVLTVMISVWISILIFPEGKEKGAFIIVSGAGSLLFFLTNSIVVFFILFEFSVVPLLLMIYMWGKGAERVSSARFFIIFTMASSSPLFIFTISKQVSGEGSMFLHSLEWSGSTFFFPLVAFMVKIPFFFFHSWLPKAHVESSLEGSMILAGIMLKVGVFGLVRMAIFIQESFSQVLLPICLVGSVMSALSSLSSDDMKMSVAFSSISHMNLSVGCFLSLFLSGSESSVMTMVSHGVSSPLLFFLVTIIYNLTNSRSMIVGKGAFSKFQVYYFFCFFLWSLNLSFPPSLSFLGELTGFISLFKVFSTSVIWAFLFFILNSFFSIFNFSVQSHMSSKVSNRFPVKEFSFLLLSLFGCVVSVLLFFSGMFLW